MSSVEPIVVRLNNGKPIAKGSIPGSISHQWTDYNGDPVPLAGFTGQFRAEALEGGSTPAGMGGGSVTVDGPNGTATYPWVVADFSEVGRFRGIIWVGDGTDRYGSFVFEWSVADAPGADPTV